MTTTRTAALIGDVILETLATMSATSNPVSRDARLSDLEIDSLDLVELAQVVEEEYGVTLPPAKELGGLATVGEVVDFLLDRLEQAAPGALR